VIGVKERDFAKSLVALVLGVDAVYTARLPRDAEGLAQEGYVAINLSKVEPLDLRDYAQARIELDRLEAALPGVGLAPDRRQYFQDYLVSVRRFLAWQEEPTQPFPTLVAELLGVSPGPPPLEPLLQDLAAKLRGAGYAGKLLDALRQFEQDRTVPATELGSTLEHYLDDARSFVSEHLFPLPEDFQFSVEVVSDVPYSAFCDYVGRVVQLNGDHAYTHEGLKHLACHEAYPGHSTHILRRELQVAAGEMTEDGLLVVTDTPTSPLFEGIGDFGLTMLGWHASEPERIAHAAMRLRSATALWAADLMARGRRAEAKALLERYGDATWAQSRLRFLDLPLRRPFIFAYYCGDQLVHELYGAHRGDHRILLAELYDRMQSPASLRLTAAERSHG